MSAEEQTQTRSHHVITGFPVGDLTVVVDGSHVVGIYFEGHRRRPAVTTFGESRASRVVHDLEQQLGEYFKGERQDFDIPLEPVGTEFQQRVWRELRAIPYGETMSYGELAARIGTPGAARAVGLANGRNPISIVVPCHRVVGSTGRLTGYAGGAERKQLLLDLERRQVTSQLW